MVARRADGTEVERNLPLGSVGGRQPALFLATLVAVTALVARSPETPLPSELKESIDVKPFEATP